MLTKEYPFLALNRCTPREHWRYLGSKLDSMLRVRTASAGLVATPCIWTLCCSKAGGESNCSYCCKTAHISPRDVMDSKGCQRINNVSSSLRVQERETIDHLNGSKAPSSRLCWPLSHGTWRVVLELSSRRKAWGILVVNKPVCVQTQQQKSWLLHFHLTTVGSKIDNVAGPTTSRLAEPLKEPERRSGTWKG